METGISSPSDNAASVTWTLILIFGNRNSLLITMFPLLYLKQVKRQILSCMPCVDRMTRQWRDIAFCLSLLSYADKALHKLNENMACFADKLADDDIYGFFCSIVSAARKFAKVETKVSVAVAQTYTAEWRKR